MNILFLTNLCSLSAIELLRERYGQDISGLTDQKFYRLIARGFIVNNSFVNAVTAIPITKTKKNYITLQSDNEDGILFNYISYIDYPILRQFSILFGSFFLGIKWLLKNRNIKKFIFCDGLNVSSCIGALALKVFGVHIMCILTDMPELMVGRSHNTKSRIINIINNIILKSFDSYVFLTEAMNDVVNVKHKPFIVMEGIVDTNMGERKRNKDTKTRKIIYAGGLNERYGVKKLIDAFTHVKGENLKLLLYGNGPMVNDIHKYENLDCRIHYMGLVPNSLIVEAELSATLMVNPRPTHEDFVKYSFPSKNMEYMASGTPLLTTKLPGMPIDYYPYVFLIDDESVDGFIRLLSDLLAPENDEKLDRIGQEAKEYVLREKNNNYQTRRIIDLFIHYDKNIY